MKYLILFLLPLVAAAKPAAKPVKKTAPKRVANKITSGKEVCQMIEKIIAKGVPTQQNVDLVVSKKSTALGAVGAISKDIGTFHIGNIYFRAVATGTEGQVYKEKCLKINFPDLDKDGVKDLEVSATVERLDPKANPSVVSTTHYERTFIYHPVEKVYEPMSGSPNPFVELVIE